MRKHQHRMIAMLLAVFCLATTALHEVAAAEMEPVAAVDSSASTADEEEEQVLSGEAEEDGLAAEPEEEDVPDVETDAPEEAEAEPDTGTDSEDPAEQPASEEGTDAAPAPEETEDTVTYTYEDDTLSVTAAAPQGALPEDVQLQVEDLTPPSADELEQMEESEATDLVDRYAAAMSTLSEQLAAEEQTLQDGRAYDIHFLTADGEEVEPSAPVQISMTYKAGLELAGAEEDPETVQLAHILDNQQVETISADVVTEEDGTVSAADFTVETFSVYVIFSGTTGTTDTQQPQALGQYGWIRFSGEPILLNSLPGGNDDNRWRKITQVNLIDNSTGQTLTSINYLAPWDDPTVEAYKFNGYDVVRTSFRQAHTGDSTTGNSLVGTYPATQYYAWNDQVTGNWEGEANVLNIYVNKTGQTQTGTDTGITSTGTRYVIRYYHADGTYDEQDGTLTSGNVSVNQSNKQKEGEVYSGMTITAGHQTVNANTTNGTATISYNSGVSLAKVNVYYKEDNKRKTGGAVPGSPQYDTKIDGNEKIYDTSRTGLHTDKTAQPAADAYSTADSGNTRTYNLTLESWNVGSNKANVGMVLDASGSMAWTSGTPTAIQKSTDEWKSLLNLNYLGTGQYSTLTADQVNKILNRNLTDNSKLSYNGYTYYVYDESSGVKEYVPLAYCDGINKSNVNFASTSYTGAGWYYVNSSGYGDYSGSNKTAKQLCGFSNRASEFYIDNSGYLYCHYYFNNSDHTSKVYIKPDDADTKSEVLQHCIAKFSSTLSALSPESQIGMTRFSRRETSGDYTGHFTNNELLLLNWTNDTTQSIAAMNLGYGKTTGTGTGPYDYGLTGATHTYSGLDAFISDLTNGAGNRYSPKVTNPGTKYLVIFTDGKDNSGTTYENQSKTYATNLRDNGYTIITVLMKSNGMESSGEVKTSTGFLTSLATPRKSTITAGTGTQDTTTALRDYYFYTADYNDATSLLAAFEEIAKVIAAPLKNYTITDYIDPRFDVLDEDGNVLTQLDSDGNFVDRPITTNDGKTATLKYDQTKKMFYIEWTGQDIPSSAQNSNGADKVSVWSSTITVRAKEDFLGGNDILTNGNGSQENRVYDPNGTNSKDFPRTTANPALLSLTMGYEDTIFLGEQVDPGALYDDLAKGADSKWYLEYLSRYDAAKGTNMLEKLKKGETVTVDYFYLPESGNQTSYAGGTLHQGDKIGTLNYEWIAVDTSSLDSTNTTIDTKDVTYKLVVTYTPDPFVDTDAYENGSTRTKALTGVSENNTTALIRNPVGTQQSETVQEGPATIHIVPGKLGIQKKVKLVKLSAGTAFTFAVDRTDPTSNATTKDYRTATVTVTSDDLNKSADADGYVTLGPVWVENLPLGTYQMRETGHDGYMEVALDAVAVSGAYAAGYTEAGTGVKDVKWYIGQKANGVPVECTYPTPQVDAEKKDAGQKDYLNAQIGQVQVTNNPIYNLPSAGGPGTYLFTVIGVAVFTTAALLLTRDWRTRKEEDEP